MGRRACLHVCAALAALLLAPLTCVTLSAQPQAVTVVSVHWGNEDFPGNAELDRSIRDALVHPGAPIDYFSEYLESDRFSGDAASAALADYIRRKYAGRRIDLVLALHDVPLQFALNHRAGLFPDAPIVYLGYTAPEPAIRTEGKGLTGVLMGDGFGETLELALRLHPATTRVFVVAGAPVFALQRSAETQLGEFAQRVEVTYIAERSMPSLLAAVRAVPENSVILYIRQSQEEPGNLLLPPDIARLVADASAVPVYGVSEDYVGTGVVGGAVHTRHATGTRLGEMALQILDGTRPQDIPIERASLTPTVDWRQVQRWGIDPSRLPAGSAVRFRELTVWQLYRGYIAAAIALVAVQALMIAALVIQRERRRETEARNRAILKAVPDAMFLLTKDGLCIDVEEPSEHGRKPAGTPRRLRDVLPPDVAHAFEEKLDGMKTQQAPTILEYVLRRPEGEHHFEARFARCGTDQMLAVVRDVTDRKTSEQALLDAQADLARVSRFSALGEFAASVAHEVRQPLTAIMVNAQTCLRWLRSDTPDLKELSAALEEVVEAGGRADELIRRNRELFTDHLVQKAPLDINGVVRDVLVLARTRIQTGQVSLTTSLADLADVYGDRVELQQVLLNLITNSIEAMESREPSARLLEITTGPAGDGAVKVSVKDTGVGFAGVDMERMFTFSYSTKPTGSGIGLSISRSIVEAHGGRLWAEPNTGRGATFSLTIPMAPVASTFRTGR